MLWTTTLEEDLQYSQTTAQRDIRIAEKNIDEKYYRFGVDMLDKFIAEANENKIDDVNELIEKLITQEDWELLKQDEDEFKKCIIKQFRVFRVKRRMLKQQIILDPKMKELLIDAITASNCDYTQDEIKEMKITLEKEEGEEILRDYFQSVIDTGSKPNGKYSHCNALNQHKPSQNMIDTNQDFENILGFVIAESKKIINGERKQESVVDHLIDETIRVLQQLKVHYSTEEIIL